MLNHHQSVSSSFGGDAFSTNSSLLNTGGVIGNMNSSPGSFLDLSRKVDQILTLLQGSNQALNHPHESILNSLNNIQNQLNRTSTYTDKTNNDTQQLQFSSGFETSELLPSLSLDPTFHIVTNESTPALSSEFKLVSSSHSTHSDPFPSSFPSSSSSSSSSSFPSSIPFYSSPPPPISSQPDNQSTEILNRIGGSSMDESLYTILNRIREHMISQNFPVVTPNTNGLRQMLIPGINDILIQASNSLILPIQNEIKNLQTIITQLNSSPTSNPNTNGQLNQLSAQVQKLYDVTNQLVGQANDNSRLIHGIGTKIQSLDRLTETINNANTLLTQSTNSHKGDIHTLVQENLLLRQNLESLIAVLNNPSNCGQFGRLAKDR